MFFYARKQQNPPPTPDSPPNKLQTVLCKKEMCVRSQISNGSMFILFGFIKDDLQTTVVLGFWLDRKDF